MSELSDLRNEAVDAEVWIQFAAAAMVYAHSSSTSAADSADRMLAEFHKRYEYDEDYTMWVKKDIKNHE